MVGDISDCPVLTVLLATYSLFVDYKFSLFKFLNGMNRLNIQLYTLVIAGIVFIPLSILLLEVMGVSGVALALCICNSSRGYN